MARTFHYLVPCFKESRGLDCLNLHYEGLQESGQFAHNLCTHIFVSHEGYQRLGGLQLERRRVLAGDAQHQGRLRVFE